MRDIETIAGQLRLDHPDVVVEPLAVRHPGADDDGLWYFRRAGCPTEIQLESPTGNCPFLIEFSRSGTRLTANTPGEAIRILLRGLDAELPSA